MARTDLELERLVVVGNSTTSSGEVGGVERDACSTLSLVSVGGDAVPELAKVLEEQRTRAARYEMMFCQNVNGLFFMTLDEPIDWRRSTDRESLLDYAFEHLRVTDVNEALCDQVGASREQLLGTTPRERWGRDRERWREHMRSLYEQGHVHHSVRAPRADGGWLDVEGEYVCTYDRLGRITGHFGSQRDISQRRATATALADSQDRLALAIAAADLAVWDLDLATGSIYFEQRWFERLGYDVDAVPWHDAAWWRSIIHPDDLRQVERCFEDHVASVAPTYRVEYRIRAAGGAWIWLHCTGRATVRDARGRPLRMVGTCQDVTECKQLQARLVESQRLAALGTLAASVGHEINNPLTYVGINLACLERELSAPAAHACERTDRLREMVSRARHGAERVRAVVRDLLGLARTPEPSTSVDLIGILERCIEIVNHQIQRRAQLVREYHPVPGVRGNEDRLVQVFSNLLANAAQAIPETEADHGQIRVTTSAPSEGRVVVEITDNGVGIDAAHLERIFDPFFTTKPAGEGTGLGLAVCRSIVSALGGEIDVQSTPGQGTTFRISLSRAEPDNHAQQTASAARAPSDTARAARLLVLDDEPLTGQSISKILKTH